MELSLIITSLFYKLPHFTWTGSQGKNLLFKIVASCQKNIMVEHFKIFLLDAYT